MYAVMSDHHVPTKLCILLLIPIKKNDSKLELAILTQLILR